MQETFFGVSRNLKNSKRHFIEAKVYKLTESVPPHNSGSTSIGYVRPTM